jgi:tetratricopeptide (TPR) repeat protein
MAKRSLFGLTLGFFSLAVVMGFAIGCFTVLFAIPEMYEPKTGSPQSASLTPSSSQVPSEVLKELKNQQQSALKAIERLQREIQAGSKQTSVPGKETSESATLPTTAMLAVFAIGILAGAAFASVGFVLWLRRRIAPNYSTAVFDVAGGRTPSRPETATASQPTYRAEATTAHEGPTKVAQAGSATEVAGAGNTRQALLDEIERLEGRIKRLEETRDSASKAGPRPALAIPPNPLVTSSMFTPSVQEQNVAKLSLGRAKRVTLLLANAETLLKAGRPKEALASAEEVLALDPTNLDTLVKKGKALEELERPEEAIAAYERAIEIDAKCTIAYLRKGELFNKLERYNEALECYEKALATHQKNSDR